MRLIDADALKKDLTRFYDGEVVARKLIDEQPTVDAVPVVRCKDCEWWSTFPASTAAPAYHECKARPLRIHTTAEDFCSRGERKDGDNG